MVKEKKILVGVFGICSLILLGLAVSYAFFSTSLFGTKGISLTADGITFKYTEGENALSLQEAMPMTDEQGMAQSNYFEFDIEAKSPEGFEIPYYITARKGTSSSNIDEAIKIGISKVSYNSKDIYAARSSSSLVEISDNNRLQEISTNGGVYEKVYSAGDVVENNIYTALLYTSSSSFATLQECEASDEYLAEQQKNKDPVCVLEGSTYVVKDRSGLYDSLEACNNAGYKLATCTIKYNSGSTYPQDIYEVYFWYDDEEFTSLSTCNDESSRVGEFYRWFCAIRYPAGTKSNEEIINIYNYDELSQYVNESIDLSKYTEKLIHTDKVPENSSNYIQKYRVRMWIDYDTDFTQAKYNNASFSLTVNVYSNGQIKAPLAPGLYDASGNLIASWDTLINTYHLDVESDYIEDTDFAWDDNSYSYIYSNPSMLNYIIANNPSLASGTKLVIGNASKIGNFALIDMASITSVVIPSSVTSIGNYALADSSNLESVTIPSSVTSIGEGAFISCSSLESITLPLGVISIGSQAFAYCDSLAAVTIPSSVTSIGEGAFSYCVSLESVTIPSSVTSLGNDAFSRCTSLTNVTISPGVASIGDNAFYDSFNITSIEIPASVISIGEEAFADCGNLEEVTLAENSNLSSIGINAFKNTKWYTTESNFGNVDVYLNGVLVVVEMDDNT